MNYLRTQGDCLRIAPPFRCPAGSPVVQELRKRLRAVLFDKQIPLSFTNSLDLCSAVVEELGLSRFAIVDPIVFCPIPFWTDSLCLQNAPATTKTMLQAMPSLAEVLTQSLGVNAFWWSITENGSHSRVEPGSLWAGLLSHCARAKRVAESVCSAGPVFNASMLGETKYLSNSHRAAKCFRLVKKQAEIMANPIPWPQDPNKFAATSVARFHETPLH